MGSMSDCFCLSPSETWPKTDVDAMVIDNDKSRDLVCMAHSCSIPRLAKAACRDAKHCVVAMQGGGVGGASLVLAEAWAWTAAAGNQRAIVDGRARGDGVEESKARCRRSSDTVAAESPRRVQAKA